MPLALAALLVLATGKPADRSYRLFLDAEKAYGEGRAEEAVKLLDEAYGLRPEPVLLYNLARAHETLGHLEQALDCYRRYLEADPKAEGKGAITARITALEGQLQERARLEAERRRAQTEAELALAAAARRRFHFWSIPVALGGAGLLAGGVLKGVALSERGVAQADPIHQTAARRYEQARGFDTAAGATLIVGAVIAAAGVVWLVASVASTPQGEQRVQLALGPGFFVVTARF